MDQSCRKTALLELRVGGAPGTKGTGMMIPEFFWEPGVAKNRIRLSGLKEFGDRMV